MKVHSRLPVRELLLVLASISATYLAMTLTATSCSAAPMTAATSQLGLASTPASVTTATTAVATATGEKLTLSPPSPRFDFDALESKEGQRSVGDGGSLSQRDVSPAGAPPPPPPDDEDENKNSPVQGPTDGVSPTGGQSPGGGGAATATPSISENATARYEHFTWSGGGVTGASHSEENRMVQQRHDALVAQLESELGPQWYRALDTNRISSEKRAVLQAVFVNFTETYVSEIGEFSRNDDCAYHLLPHQQLMCHLWGEVDAAVYRPHRLRQKPREGQVVGEGSSIDTNDAPPSHPSSTPPALGTFLAASTMRRSLCPLFMGCAYWSRGRFNQTLTPELLARIYESTVLPVMQRSANSSDVLLRNLVHGGPHQSEFPWLWPRMVTQDRDHAKRERMAVKGIHATAMPTIDVRPIFQGGEIGFDRQTLTGLVRGNGDASLQHVDFFSASQTVAILYHRAVEAAATRQRQRPSLSICGLQPSRSASPPVHVFVFSGDSLTRELFFRLVHHIRHGVQRVDIPYPILNGPVNDFFTIPTAHEWMPFFDIPIWDDFLYAVHESHDEFLHFPSVVHDRASQNTVNRFFVDLAQKQCEADKRRSAAAGGGAAAEGRSRLEGDGSPPAAALFYILFLWDPFTQRPRRDVQLPCKSNLELDEPEVQGPLHQLFHQQHRLRKVTAAHPVIPLQMLNAVVPTHVAGAAYWERSLAQPLEHHWHQVATSCAYVCPHGAKRWCSSAAPQPRGYEDGDGVTVQPQHEPQQTATTSTTVEQLLAHTFGGVTDLYVMTAATGDALGHFQLPVHLRPQLVSEATPWSAEASGFHAPPEIDFTNRHEVIRAMNDDRFRRTLALFGLFKTINATWSKHRQDAASEVGSTMRPGTRRLRILDKGKIPYAPANVFPRADGVHLCCHGYTRLFGKSLDASIDDKWNRRLVFGADAPPHSSVAAVVVGDIVRFFRKIRSVLRSIRSEMASQTGLGYLSPSGGLDQPRKEQFSLMPLANGTKGFLRPEYRPHDQCGDFGNLLLLHAVLYDTLPEKRRREWQQKRHRGV